MTRARVRSPSAQRARAVRKRSRCTVGVISDTHGLLREQAVQALQGVDHIVHAGDIGAESVLEELRQIAPVTAVRGNNDREAWCDRLAETELIELCGRRIFVIHQIAQLDVDPQGQGLAAVIFGHSHKPSVDTQGGVLFLNPGSAGPRRFKLPTSVARLVIDGDELAASIHELDIR